LRDRRDRQRKLAVQEPRLITSFKAPSVDALRYATAPRIASGRKQDFSEGVNFERRSGVNFGRRLTELDLGHVKANAKVAENLFRKATGEGRESVTAAIFWLKTRARWKETSAIEHGGPEGDPFVIVTGVPRGDDARELSYPEPRKTAPLSLTHSGGDRD
jgi:hypothetical protein